MLPDLNSVDRQLFLNLEVRPALDREAFFVSNSNQRALQFIEGWRDWPERRLCLTGDAGNGKTHLAHVWTALAAPVHVCSMKELTPEFISKIDGSEHVLIDDVEQTEDETSLLHLMNRLAGGGGHLLFVSRKNPSSWSIELADLRSRLTAMTVVPLTAPDDDLLTAMFQKQFQDRQISVSDIVISYLIKRVERTGLAVGKMVAILDAMSLARKKPITQSMATEALDKEEQGGG